MLLLELFDHKFPSLKKVLRNAILDILTPLSSHGAQKISIQMLIDRLKRLDLGLDICSDTIKDCVDPNSIPFVTDIDDQYVYLNGTSDDQNQDEGDMSQEPEEPADPVGDEAKKQATDNLKPKIKTPLPRL